MQRSHIREQFPFFQQDPCIHYLDSAATSQKPKRVIDRLSKFYLEECSNVHRGVYTLAENATSAYEGVRKQLANFLGGVSAEELIFTYGTTDSMNLIARSWGADNLQEGDEILLLISEHHSNIVPWELIAKEKGARLVFVPLDENLRVNMRDVRDRLSTKTKVLSFAHVSNVLGVIHPVEELIACAKEVGAISVIDGAQSLPHFNVDLKTLDCDFYTFSSHKMCGPTGVGVLYGKSKWLQDMSPYRGGGEMIQTVTTEGSQWAEAPHKFEAGTPHIGGVVAFGETISFWETLDREALQKEELALAKAFVEEMKVFKNLEIFVPSFENWIGTIPFHHKTVHPHDIGSILDSENVCIRAGNHCAQPLMNFLKVPATTRISPYMYNDESDLQKFLVGMRKVEKLFSP